MQQTVTILMFPDKTENYALARFESLTGRKIADLRTFFIQKIGVSINEGSERF